MLQKLLQKRPRGFTIIEVMIVLAIAGLIMVVVLIAVPQLQRSQRNNATIAILDRVFTEMSNYASNNQGRFPVGSTIDTFCERYLQKTGSCAATDTGATFINDPRTGTPVVLAVLTDTTTDPEALPGTGIARTLTVYSDDSVGSAGFRCNGEVVAAGTGARSVAAVIPLEGGAFACRDNQ
jgi:prepilin-type N-terminal cleavage/methylation domain-containing protein